MPRPRPRIILAALALACAAGVRPGRLAADAVVMKNGLVYEGNVDRDNTLVTVDDGLKRVVVRDSKMARIDRKLSFPNLEGFQFVQPLLVHAGAMPTYAINIEASEWDDRGRRDFSYVGPKGREPVRMKQAINDLTPRIAKLRGIDGFWVGQVPTPTLPKETVLSLLGKVDRANQSERLRVGRFLIQLEWYPEARAELDAIARDFPELKATVDEVRQTIVDLEARRRLADIATREKAGQPGEVLRRLRAFPTGGVGAEILEDVRTRLRAVETQAAADEALAEGLRAVADGLPADRREVWKGALAEVLRGLHEAPDAVRGRLDAYAKADAGTDPTARFALAMSGWALGAEMAVADLDEAESLWKVREAVEQYLGEDADVDRASLLVKLEELAPEMETVARLAQLLPPPLRAAAGTPGAIQVHRVRADDNVEPTDYAVLLPPEYDPLRSYPAVVALHTGRDPAEGKVKGPATAGIGRAVQAAVSWWAEEANRRGYIVIAPEYGVPGSGRGYRYTTSEHAAVSLALRDARRRYSIDGDRVFLGGQLEGGNMAWDFGLAHPDLFAGVVVVSGLPGKYVNRYISHTELVPHYIAEGDLAPASIDIVFGEFVKPMIERAWDVTYVSYYKRGLEEFPEEAAPAFDWMDRRTRDPAPRSFKVEAARVGDDRFYGVVIQEFLPGRTTAPEAVEPTGKNLNPAKVEYRAGASNNLLSVTLSGVRRVDLWLSPKVLDFGKKLEIRINGRTQFKGMTKVDYAPMLDDLRMRGDRQQMYWYRYVAGG